MFGCCRVVLFAYQANTLTKALRNINTTGGKVNLSQINGERFLGVQGKRNVMFAHARKGLEVASVGKKLTHNSTPLWSNYKGQNQRKEEIKNYIFLGTLTVIGTSMYLFSLTMRRHEDYVIVNPEGKKN